MRLAFIVLLSLHCAGYSAELRFDRAKIGETTYEACSVVDVDRDGNVDLVTGEYWIAGPDFSVRHKTCSLVMSGDYFDDFADFPMDVNGDGYMDIVSGAWWGEAITWRENPKGASGEWTIHEVAKVGNVERPCFWDIDGDGTLEVVPNTPGNPQRIMRLRRDASGKGTGGFDVHTISEVKTGHGLGFGDINGDGRGDLIVHNGWFEAPTKPFDEEWNFHSGLALFESSSVPILALDINGDGRVDLISGNGHGYGLAWWEQGGTAESRTWIKHDIETDRSQFHELVLADLDRDGEVELITGKRWRAHSGGDPGALEPVGLYYYTIAGGAFERHVIDYGPAEETSGSGIYLWVSDIDGNGWLDIAAPGKEGLYIFYNQGFADSTGN